MTRDTILAAVRAATPKALPPSAAPRSVSPAAVTPTHDIATQFKTALENRSAIVVEVPDFKSVPAAIAQTLKDADAPLAIRSANTSHMRTLNWTAVGVTHSTGRADQSDTCCISTAFAGIAETGTLVLASSPENPSTLALLPETHIVVIEAAEIVPRMEDALARFMANNETARTNATAMPRSLMLVSGPSRTGDIGGRIVLGAHGPRRLCVVIVSQGETGPVSATL